MNANLNVLVYNIGEILKQVVVGWFILSAIMACVSIYLAHLIEKHRNRKERKDKK